MTAEQQVEIPVHPVPKRLLDAALCPKPHVSSIEQYREMWQESVEQPEKFFGNVSFLYIYKDRYGQKLIDIF